jgi:hypothetical protein
VSDFIYYAYRPGMVQGLGTIYRVDSEFWTGGGAIQEVYNRQTGEWVPTDMLVYRVVHGDVWLERLGFDPSTELVNESSGSVVPLKNTVEYLFASPKYTEKVVTVHTLREVKEVIPSTLEKMKTSGRRWVVILETSKDPTMYVQVLITAAGSIWRSVYPMNFSKKVTNLTIRSASSCPLWAGSGQARPHHPTGIFTMNSSIPVPRSRV